ncbi:MAG: glycosyltransferase family 2 protein [Daejeonella sp.]
MKAKLSTSLIISTYNWPKALSICLKSVLNQHILPDEVIIADDGSNEETRILIDNFRESFPMPLIHIWHEDIGFRKTIILNKAIAVSSGIYIIQIDGDIIIHPKFIEDHISEAEPITLIKGSRVLLTEELTDHIIRNNKINFSVLSKGIGNKINALRIPFLSSFFRGNPKKTNDIRGCNFAFWKTDFIAVNGYNINLTGWGHEDIELAARLVNSGVKRKAVKFKAICFHLHHKLFSREDENSNLNAYYNTVENGITKCPSGFNIVNNFQ